MALPTERQLEALCDDVVALAERIRRDGPDVLRRAKMGTRVGYPTATFSTRVTGSRNSDPTSGPAIDAVDDPKGDPVRKLALTMTDELRGALKALTIADSSRANTRPPEPSPDPDPGDLWCVSCLRFELHEPVVRAGRCEFCADWRAGHGLTDPPEHAIRDHRVGRREHAPRPGERAAGDRDRSPVPSGTPEPAREREPASNRSAVTAAQRLLGERRR